jgi:threonine/homoserine/homoserine lactone efflux protein
MNMTLVGSFLLLAVPAFFTPGPNNLMLMTSSAKFGLKRTVPHGTGVTLGFPVMVFLVSLGLGEIFHAVPVLKTVLIYFAAAYLLWMAWHLLGLKVGDIRAGDRPFRIHEAALFQWINPKGWAMAMSFAAAFVVSGPDRFTSIVWLTLGCLTIAPLSTLTWMVFGERLQVYLKKTESERFLGAILALLLLAAVILFFI